jgi:hypothetical protein
VPCIYTQENYYLHVKKNYTMWQSEIHRTILESDHRSIFRRNVWGTIAWQERSTDLILIGDLIGETPESSC